MHLRPAIIIYLSLIALTSSCISYGNYTKSELISVTEYSCNQKSDTLNVLFEGEKFDFEYDRIGLVKVEGKRFTSDNEVLNHLKYQAWRNCADAIINVSLGSKTREEGMLLITDDEDDDYTSTVFTGLAVKIRKDSTFSHQDYPYATKNNFVQQVKKDIKSETNQGNFEAVATVVGLTALIIYGATQL